MKKTSKTSPKPAPAKKSAPVVRKAPVAPAVKKTAAKAVVTTISAHIDVGFGNLLYVRGDGPGLSWDRGLQMQCVADDGWSLVLSESSRPVVFKFLLNDEVWSTGEDYTAKPGAVTVFTPLF
jgi:hypothetical protein